MRGSSMESETISRCRICSSVHLDPIFDIGDHVSAGIFPAVDEPDPPVGRLRLVICRDCGLAQLDRNFDPSALYHIAYGYRSGINNSMRNHLAGIAEEAMRLVSFGVDDVVLDIASNDGTLLKAYPKGSVTRVGVDPTIAQFEKHYPSDVIKVADFFDAAAYLQVTDAQRAKVITSIAMLYDLADPQKFVCDVAKCLAPDGLWIFEQSYVGTMLARNAFDTICHEHLEYYGLAQIERLLQDNDLRAIDVSFNDVNGGSFRVHACHRAATFKPSARLEKARRIEQNSGNDKFGAFDAFRSRVINIKSQVRDFIQTEHAAGKLIYVYGASTKGNIFLQYCELDNQTICACADRNPEKWGRRTPGTHIPIVSEAEAREAQPDYFLVLPWHFRPEFLEREREFLRSGGQMIFPLPEFTVVSADDLL